MCCNDYYESEGLGTGGVVAVVIVAIAVKISIISCIVYYCRRRSYGYVVAPNPTATVAVVQSNQTSYPCVQQQMPMTHPPQYTPFPSAAAPQNINYPAAAPPNVVYPAATPRTATYPAATVPHTQNPPAYVGNAAQLPPKQA